MDAAGRQTASSHGQWDVYWDIQISACELALLAPKKASLVHNWLEFDGAGRADEITSPGLACQPDPAQLVQFCSLKTCSVSVVQQFISVGCFRRYGRDP